VTSLPCDELTVSHLDCHYDLESTPLQSRVVNIWKSLPGSVIGANNVNTFKTD